MQETTPTRRQFLSVAVAGTATLTFAGYASAAADEQQYLVRLSEAAAERRLRRRGFSIETILADGQVLVVVGEPDASDDLDEITGVSEAVPDFRFELEEPELYEEADFDVDGDGDDGNGKGNGGGNGKGNDDDTEEESDDGPALFHRQWDKQVTETPSAHDRATGAGRRVAVIDTGVDHDHPDLDVDVDASASMIDGDVGDHTGDVGYHGTHVAGIATATGAVGVLGTAPDATVVSIRVFPEDGLATFSDVLLAMEYAADAGADAANMSLGTPPIPPQANAAQYRRIMEPVAQGVTAQGTMLVGSAGNSGADLQHGGFFTLPNSLAGVTSVSATGPNDRLTFYSNYGTNEIDVGAPGGGYETLEKTLEEDPEAVGWPFPTNLVLSTIPGGDYGYAAGTSMAAPQVSATVAVLREAAPDANSNQLEQAIESGADLVDGAGDAELGAGRLNVSDALDETA